VALTQLQITQLNSQDAIARGIQTGASNLNYISNNYFLYQSSSSIDLWQTEFSTLSAKLAQLNSTNTQQQTLVNTVNDDMANLNSVFEGVTTFLNNAPRNVSIRVLPNFQTQWNRMAVQIQALSFDSQQLSQAIRDQSNQTILSNTISIIALMALFAAFFVTIYLLNFRRTLKSISELKTGIDVVGSGNLEHEIQAGNKDEIADISKSVNQMSANLKSVTVSKAELETEVDERKKAEEALLKAKEQTEFDRKRLETILETSPSAIVIIEAREGKFSYVNKRAAQLYGFDTIGINLDENVAKVKAKRADGTDYPIEEMPVSRSLKLGQETHNEEMIIERADGQILPIVANTAPLRDMQGNITSAIVVFEDITERKKAEEAVARQAELIDLSPDAIIVQQLDGTITFWSNGAEKLYGWTKSEAIGQDIHTLLMSEFPQPLEEILEKVKLDGKWSGELTHNRKDGEKLIVQSYWLGKFGGNGKIESILESNADITVRVQLQLKLEESAVLVEEYANQMEELANKRAEQLKDAERLATIGATAGMVGHDIRNPLQAITGDVFLAKTELIAIPDSEEKKNLAENLTEIEKNVDYINKIVADLQDFARPLNPRTEETDLKLVIDDLLKKNGLPENVKVTVKVETDARKVVADSTFINRIMYNLVTNAVQAMPKGGKLTIHTYKEAKEVLITVKDTGVGIPEKVKGKLFTPMFTTKSKGQGFGLPVIKRMTESLGGTVTFESEEGKGTTFVVRLPSKNSLKP
jgi:PAS domain S-box-containing protein